MGFLDRLFGSEPERPRDAPRQDAGAPDAGMSEDEQALARYRYLLRTAPPETIEQVHAEAFARLTDEQRRQVLAELSTELPEVERPRGDDPQALARAATRAEYTNPGFMERTFGPREDRGGPGFGSMLGASLLGTVAGYVVASALVSTFFAPTFADQGSGGGSEEQGSDTGADPGADAAGADASGADSGWGGDFGGGDFGGGFGGGDFGGGDFGF